MKRVLIAVVLFAAVSLGDGAAPGKATEEPASETIRMFYEALSAGTDVSALFGRATSPEWASCGGNDVCRSRDQVIRTVIGLHTAVPDLKWEIKEVLLSDNRIIVRGEASGTPAGDFMGVPQGGKSFKLMSIDIHTVESGKITRSYHVEDWVGATRQLSAK